MHKARANIAQNNNPIQLYDSKFQENVALNIKLKELYQTILNNQIAKKIENNHVLQQKNDETSITKLKKSQNKLIKQIQTLTNNLNSLINENQTLKNQVNVSRNSRVIYSNVYKNIQKDIHKNQFAYKLAIIQFLCYFYADIKLNQKMQKAKDKIIKQINQLQHFIKNKQKNTSKNTKRINNISSKNVFLQTLNKKFKEDSQIYTNSIKMTQDEIPKKQIFRAHSVTGYIGSKQQIQKQQIQKINIEQKQSKKYKNHGHSSFSISKNIGKNTSDEQDELFQQMKTNYYIYISKHLKQILGCQSLAQAYSRWQNIDLQLQKQFNLYLQHENKLKQLDQQQQKLRQQLKLANNTSNESLIKTQQQKQLQQILAQLQKQKLILRQNQLKLTKIIDLNAGQLNDKEIQHHIHRISKSNAATHRQLDKLFQSVGKEISTHKILKNYHEQKNKK